MSVKLQWTNRDVPDQTGRCAVVTGANSGIGFETAKILAQKGAHVIMACRNKDKANVAIERMKQESREISVELIPLDLSSLQSVRVFAATFCASHKRLDLLINNAGVMLTPSRVETKDGFELQFGINHIGHFALTLRLLKILLATEKSRVINLSSVAHRAGTIAFDDLHWKHRPYKMTGSYSQSKLANLLFTLELQRLLKSTKTTTTAVAAHPGWTRTNLQDESRLLRLLNPLLAMQPWQGALPTLYAATAEQAKGGKYYGPDGFYEMRGYPTCVGTSEQARNMHDAKRLWAMSEALTELNFGDSAGQSNKHETRI